MRRTPSRNRHAPRPRSAVEPLERRLLMSLVPIATPVNVASLTSHAHGDQELGSSRTVAVDAAGDYRVTWLDQFYDTNLDTRLFTAAGVPKGPVQVVDADATNIDTQPTVAMDAAGDYVIAWTESGTTVVAQRFAADGTAQGGQLTYGPIQLLGRTIGSATEPSVAMDAKGDYALAFYSHNGLTLTFGIGLVLNTATGGSGTATGISLAGTSGCDEPSVAMSASGNFVVAYRMGSGTADSEIAAQAVSAAGAVTATVAVTSADLTDAQPSVAIDVAGNFTVAYTYIASETTINEGGLFNLHYNRYQTQVRLRRYQANGKLQGSTVFVDGTSAETGAAYEPSATMDANGDLVVAYTFGGSYDGTDPNAGEPVAVAALYDPTGTEVQTGIAVSAGAVATSASQPSVALNGTGGLAAAWLAGGSLTEGEGFASDGVDTQGFVNNAYAYKTPASSNVQLVGGMTVKYTVGITRDPSYTGPVTVTLTGVPAGVSYTISPDTSAASDPRTITFTTADNVAAAVATATLYIAGDGLTLTPKLSIQTGPSAITSVSQPLVRGYGILIQGTGFVPGSIVQFGDPGQNVPSLRATPTIADSDPLDPGTLNVVIPATAVNGQISVIRPNGLPIVSAGSLTYVNILVTGVDKSTAFAPYLNTPGTTVTISGYGFKPGAMVEFGDDVKSTALSVNGAGTTLTAHPSLESVNGAVTVINPDGTTATSSQSVTIDDFPNTYGFNFPNEFDTTTDLTDLSELFGYDATHVNLLLAHPPSPFALAFLYAVRGDLDDGQCFGFGLAASRFFEGDASVKDFPPVNAALDAYGLDAPNLPSNPNGYGAGSLLAYIHEEHIAQDSAEALQQEAANADGHKTSTAAQMYGELSGYLSAGRPTLVCFHDFNEGHCVLAYGLEPINGSTSDFYIDVADPNKPSPSPQYGLSLYNLQSSRILVDGNQWSYDGDFALPANEQDWSGPFCQMTYIPYGDIPVTPTLPDSLEGLLIALDGASVTQVSDPAGRTLFNADGSLNANPATSLTDTTTVRDDLSTGAPPIAVGEANITQTLAATGTAFSEVYMRNGFGVQLLNGTDPKGAVDTVGLNSDADAFSFTTTGPARQLDAELMATPSTGAVRTATFSTTTFTNAGDTVSFDSARQGVTFVHKGAATTMTLSLGGTDANGNPETFSTGAVKLAAGDTAVFSPANWAALNGTTVVMTVTHVNGTKSVVTMKNLAYAAIPAPVAGTAYTGTLATFIPANATPPAGGYAVSIDWGDGSTATAGTAVANGSGGYAISGSHVYATAGYYEATYTVTAAGGITETTGTAEVDVHEAPLSVTARAIGATTGQALSGVVVATLTDGNPNEPATGLTATVNWGDGTTSAGQVVQTSAGHFNVTGSHTYAKSGTFSVVTSVTADSTTETIQLIPMAVPASGGTFSGVIGSALLPQPGTPLADYSGTINWGDGATTTAILALAGEQVNFSGTHYYGSGYYMPTLTLTGGLKATATATATAAPPTATIAGTVFNDPNKNGKQDAGDLPLAGWEVYLDANDNGKLDAGERYTFTAAAGTYSFGTLGVGTYVVRELPPANWFLTLPNGAAGLVVNLTSGQQATGENIGNYTAVQYLSAVATTAGLAAWWTFDAASGANSVVNGITGTLEGGATIAASAGAPIAGEAVSTGLSLNGTNAFLNSNLTTQYQFATAATYNVWINLGGTPAAGGKYTIIAKSDFADDLDLQVESDGTIHFYTDTGTSTSFAPASLKGWHMVTAEFDTAAKVRKIFWDGALVASTAPYGGAHEPSTTPLSIGESDVFTGRFFDGSIDEASVWTRALTASEILALYAAAE